MHLGEYLKNCRERYKRTQPDVANQIDIEQSYLSKIESGKSIPSNDVFNKLVNVYEIDIDDLISRLSTQEHQKLADITAINHAILATQKGRSDFAKKMSITGLVMLTLGVGLLFFAMLPIKSEPQYSYRSEGVLTLKEELNIFDLVYQDIQELNNNAALLAKRSELLTRIEQQDILQIDYKGEGYVVNTAEGRRFFKLIHKQEALRDYWNRWFIVPALMLLVAGTGCVFISKRWSKN